MGDPLSAVAAEDHSILALGANNGIRRNEEGAGAYIKYCSRERCSGGTWRRLAITIDYRLPVVDRYNLGILEHVSRSDSRRNMEGAGAYITEIARLAGAKNRF